MCQGCGAVSTLFLLVIFDAEQASQVLQRLQVLEQAATEQLNARRGAERALVEAQTRITQLDQALQQGGRLGTAAGQVVDIRVPGRPDKWDGSEKACPKWSFVVTAFAGASGQALSADMTTAECSTDVMSNDTMTGEKKARSVQLYFDLDHVVHWKSSGSHCKMHHTVGALRRGELSLKLTLQRTMRDML